VFPLGQIADVVNSPSQNLRLISCEIIFEVFQFPTYMYVKDKPERHRLTGGRTDGQTDDLLWYNRALCGIAQ